MLPLSCCHLVCIVPFSSEYRTMGLNFRFYKERDPTEVYDLCYRIYIYTGLWRYHSPDKWKRKAYKAYQSFIFLIYSVAVVLFVIDGIMVRNDLDKLSFNLSSSFLAIINAAKFAFLLMESDTMDEVHAKLKNHLHVKTVGKSEEDKNIFRQKAIILSLLMILFYSLLCSGMPVKALADTALDFRLYLIPMPYRDALEPYYEIIYYQQAFLVFHFLLTVLTHDLLVFTVILRFVGHFEVLEKNFLKLKSIYPRRNYEIHVYGYKDFAHENSANDVFNKRTHNSEKVLSFLEANYASKASREKQTYELLKESVYHHQIMLRELNTFSRLYSKPLLVQACGVGFLIGIVVIQIFFLARQLNALLVQQVMYVATTLWNIFYLCSFADELTTKSLAAADALYDIPWYEMDPKSGQMVHFTLKKLMAAPKLKGGGMIVINRLTYLKFLQISYNLIAVLRHVYQKNIPEKRLDFI